MSVALREGNITEFEEVKFIKHDRLFKIRDFEPEVDCVGGLSKSCLQLRILASPSMIKELQISVSRQSGSGKSFQVAKKLNWSRLHQLTAQSTTMGQIS